MFSIIICSIHPPQLEQLRANIADTIGQPYELLVWDNREAKKGLCEVYNMLAAKAVYPYLCFVHEDIIMSSRQWGSRLINTFEQNESLGLIGISGSKYKSKTLSGTATGMLEYDYLEILHRNAKQENIELFSNPSGSDLEHTVTLDGVFLITRKTVWQEIPFDEKMLKGFHLYDLDFSFRVQQKHRISVLYDMGLTHLTEGGSFGDQWLDDTIRWHQKYKKDLPVFVDIQEATQRGLESKIRKKWLFRLRTEKISLKNKIRWIYYSGAVVDIGSWPYIALFLFGKNFRKKS
jgi:hypothetical protein